MPSYSAILLSGGTGQRMGSSTPKQYHKLKDKIVALYSLETFIQLKIFENICVVCEEKYQKYFPHQAVIFAKPGLRRQDSVKSGLKALKKPSDFTVVHDIARPFVCASSLKKLLKVGTSSGAATLGHKVKSTIKQVSKSNIVQATLNKEHLWDIQTPQLVKTDILIDGFKKIEKDNVTVSDDVSIAELLGKPVTIVENSSSNIKITTKEDMAFAKYLIHSGEIFG